MDIPALYCTPFHESSNRPHLIAGCEPAAIGVAFVLCLILIISVPTWWGIGGAVFLFLFLRQVLREMAKDDPQMLKVHHEAQRYNQGVWTAKAVREQRWRSK